MSNFVRAILKEKKERKASHCLVLVSADQLVHVLCYVSRWQECETLRFLTQRSHWPCGRIWPESGPANHSVSSGPLSRRTLSLWTVTALQHPKAAEEKHTWSLQRESKTTGLKNILVVLVTFWFCLLFIQSLVSMMEFHGTTTILFLYLTY